MSWTLLRELLGGNDKGTVKGLINLAKDAF